MENWISTNQQSGTSGTNLVTAIISNNSGSSRTGEITVTASKFGRTKTAIVSVSQSSPISGINMTDITPDGTGGTYIVVVISESPYTLTVSDSDWVLVSPSSGGSGVTTFTVTIPGNGTGSGRTGGITATTTDNQYSDSISFTQPSVDYSTMYFTTRSLEDNNTISFNMYNQSSASSMSYSTDGGLTWNTVYFDGTNKTISVSGLSSGQTVMWRGIGDSWNLSHFDSTGEYEVYGNAMSLLKSYRFESDNTFTGTYALSGLFSGSTGLTSAKNMVLPAMVLSGGCYSGMFQGCTALTEAPELPATTLANLCYMNMFQACMSLTEAPELPPTEMKNSCYKWMFSSCALTEAPALPATTLAPSCYFGMFDQCIYLTTPPELPATTLADSCYRNMFRYCLALTEAPDLPAPTLVDWCYESMFQHCTGLTYIRCLATSGMEQNMSTGYWVEDVSGSGTFVKAEGTTWTIDSIHGIPIGWTVIEEIVYKDKYLTTRSLVNNNTISFITCASTVNATSISYSTDNGSTWNTTMMDGTKKTISVSGLSSGDTVLWKGIANAWGTDGNFTSTGNYEVEGNIMSLLHGDNFQDKVTLTANVTFAGLFADGNANTTLLSAENLMLPATTITEDCYSVMFWNCKALTKAPKTLPATTLADFCYYYMFSGCTSLTTAPELPASTLTDWCYTAMFYGCTSLTTATELPATTLANYCYEYMFKDCTSLTTAPELPATTLASNCYYSMFQGCTSLSYIKCLATSGINTNSSTNDWVKNVSGSGTFVKAYGASWPTGAHGIPSGWTVQDA